MMMSSNGGQAMMMSSEGGKAMMMSSEGGKAMMIMSSEGGKAMMTMSNGGKSIDLVVSNGGKGLASDGQAVAMNGETTTAGAMASDDRQGHGRRTAKAIGYDCRTRPGHNGSLLEGKIS
jgi:hypothetical protein